MPTYTDFDSTKPNPATQAGTAFGNSCNSNDVALRDAIISGQMKGFLYSQSGGSASEPAVQYWKNGAVWLAASNTWNSTGAKSGNLDSQVWQYSIDSGATYATLDTVACTFDASGNLTATTGGGSMLTWLLAKLAPLKTVIAGLASHIALTGTSAHGLGTMSTQAANAVAITGGTVNGASVGATTPAAGHFTYVDGTVDAAATPGAGAGVTVDWSKDASTITNSGTNVLTFSNIPASGRKATRSLRVSNLTNTTFPAAVTWGSGGKPAIAAVTWVEMWTIDGGVTIYAAVSFNA